MHFFMYVYTATVFKSGDFVYFSVFNLYVRVRIIYTVAK